MLSAIAMTIRSWLGLLALVSAVAGEAVNLAQGNFNAEVHESGKNAFVKFLAPW